MSDKRELKPKYKRLSNFGSSYIIPKDMTKSEFLNLVSEWDKKLQKSGQYNIEDFDASTGTTSPFLYTNPDSKELSGSHYAISGAINPSQQEYYRLCRIFTEHANFRELFKNRAPTYKAIFSRHADGMSYREVLKSYNFMRNRIGYAKRSIFWLHHHMGIIIKSMLSWQSEHPEGAYYNSGEKIPELLEVYIEDLKGK